MTNAAEQIEMAQHRAHAAWLACERLAFDDYTRFQAAQAREYWVKSRKCRSWYSADNRAKIAESCLASVQECVARAEAAKAAEAAKPMNTNEIYTTLITAPHALTVATAREIRDALRAMPEARMPAVAKQLDYATESLISWSRLDANPRNALAFQPDNLFHKDGVLDALRCAVYEINHALTTFAEHCASVGTDNAQAWGYAARVRAATLMGFKDDAQQHEHECIVRCELVRLRRLIRAAEREMKAAEKLPYDAQHYADGTHHYTMLQMWHDAATACIASAYGYHLREACAIERVEGAAQSIMLARAERKTRKTHVAFAAQRAEHAANEAERLAFDGPTRNRAAQAREFARLSAQRFFYADALSDAEIAEALHASNRLAAIERLEGAYVAAESAYSDTQVVNHPVARQARLWAHAFAFRMHTLKGNLKRAEHHAQEIQIFAS